MSAHENLSRHAEVKASSDRVFGLVFTAVLAAIGLWPLRAGKPVRIEALGLSGAFLLISLVIPALLAPLNRLWARLGFLLNRVVSPIVTAVLFFLVFAPVGFLVRLAGKDLLRLHFDRSTRSYWIVRKPPGPAPETMSNPF